nr:Unknown Function [uncultured bacterium]
MTLSVSLLPGGKMNFTEECTAFVASSGKMFVYANTSPYNGLLYCDGETFYELVIYGYGGTTLVHRIAFCNTDNGINGRLHREDQIITYGGEEYVRQDVPPDLSKVSIKPALRKVFRLFGFPEDKRYLYMSFNCKGPGYAMGYRLYVATDGVATRGLKTIPDTTLGSRTEYPTSEGVFVWMISPQGGSYINRWNGIDLKLLDSTQYDIHEMSNEYGIITAK